MTIAVNTLDRLESGTLTNGFDATNLSSLNNGCFASGGNITSALCINSTNIGNFSFPLQHMDYYYYDNDAGWNFLDIYYSSTRFAVETAMAVLSLTLNVLEMSLTLQEDPMC